MKVSLTTRVARRTPPEKSTTDRDSLFQRPGGTGSGFTETETHITSRFQGLVDLLIDLKRL